MADRPADDEVESGQVRVPYGPPIFDAIARGDLFEMRAVAEEARRALYGVRFESVPPESVTEVKEALEKLERAILRVERQRFLEES
jgi:Domain of unknown function (DUF1843)